MSVELVEIFRHRNFGVCKQSVVRWTAATNSGTIETAPDKQNATWPSSLVFRHESYASGTQITANTCTTFCFRLIDLAGQADMLCHYSHTLRWTIALGELQLDCPFRTVRPAYINTSFMVSHHVRKACQLL